MARLFHPRRRARRGAPALSSDPAPEIRADPFPSPEEFLPLWRESWGEEWEGPLPDWTRSLVHLGAYDGGRLVGYVNVATDGSRHAFLLDTTVHPVVRRIGLGTALVRQAVDLSRARGAIWMHADFEPHLEGFYRACGFLPTAAGLIRLTPKAPDT